MESCAVDLCRATGAVADGELDVLPKALAQLHRMRGLCNKMEAALAKGMKAN
jgi:hypothetical protein